MWEIRTSRCLHHPDYSVGRHMCIYESTLWIRMVGEARWVKVDWPKSQLRVREWLGLCSSWDDVHSLEPDLCVHRDVVR